MFNKKNNSNQNRRLGAPLLSLPDQQPALKLLQAFPRQPQNAKKW